MKRESQLLIRLSTDEKAGFREAAALAGMQLSAWARAKLRLAAIRDLEGAGRRAAFIPELPIKDEDE